MEFRRINKDTITCIITEDDMYEQGIKLEDLFEKKKEAMDFLHDVMKKAEEEVDYKPTGSFMPLQITVLPDHSISLTLSENASASISEIIKNLTEKAGIKLPKKVLEDLGDAAADEDRISRINEYLKSLKEFTSTVKKAMEDTVTPETLEKLTSQMDELPLGNGKSLSQTPTINRRRTDDASRKKDERRINYHEVIYSFNDLRTVIDFCRSVPDDIQVGSALYKNNADEKYYLHLSRLDEDPRIFAGVFTIAYEFGQFYARDLNIIAHIRENFECIIAVNAIKILGTF